MYSLGKVARMGPLAVRRRNTYYVRRRNRQCAEKPGAPQSEVKIFPIHERLIKAAEFVRAYTVENRAGGGTPNVVRPDQQVEIGFRSRSQVTDDVTQPNSVAPRLITSAKTSACRHAQTGREVSGSLSRPKAVDVKKSHKVRRHARDLNFEYEPTHYA